MDAEEIEAAKNAGFHTHDCFSDLDSGHIVVPRYSVLPFIDDVYREFNNIGCMPINKISAVKWIADLGRYTELLGELTPRTWNQDELCKLPTSDMSFVLKGGTNSKKHYWNTHMFAKDKREAIRVFGLLAEDCMIGCQPIYIREWVPLVTYMIGINDLPITKEFRLFYYKKKLLASGFYWQNYVDDLVEIPRMDVPPTFLKKVTDLIAPCVNFYVVDIGQKIDGSWTVIELNSGEMSGLSCVNPTELYTNLAKEMNRECLY